MLLFYRGSWCPFCLSHLEDIQSLFPDLKEHNIQLLAISPDKAEKSQMLAKKFNQPYIFLQDTDLALAKKYGIQRSDSLPHPAVFLINRDGQLIWYYAGQDYKQRPSASQLRDVINRLL